MGMQGEFGIQTMQMHLKERESLKKQTRGNEDFTEHRRSDIDENKGRVTIILSKSVWSFRFKPIHINWSLVRGKQFAKPRSNIDWFATLALQIEQDLPVMTMHNK